MDFNLVLQEVGDFGVYQKLLCLFLVIPSACLCALVYFAQFFIILVPDHHCKLQEESKYGDMTFNNSNISSPFEEHAVTAGQCEMSFSSDFPEIASNFTTDVNKTTGCLYGWVYNFSELYPTIATDVCDIFLILFIIWYLLFIYFTKITLNFIVLS